MNLLTLRSIFFIIILSYSLLNLACESESKPAESGQDAITYLALGDSYTIGEAVAEDLRWPVQLADRMNAAGIVTADPTIFARTGWTTDELTQAIADSGLNGSYDLVSLLIGVNNQYRGYDIDVYAIEFEELLMQAVAFAGSDTNNVFVLSIPDYGVTPFAAERNPPKIAMELDEFNSVAQSICEGYGIPFIEITEHSRLAAEDPALIASDQLHPSGKMYAHWADESLPIVKELLKVD